jgi:serine/threonine-protein kinase
MQEWSSGSDADVLRLGLPPGTQLNGIYEIDQLIGIGGMGEIYRGHGIETGDRVAIKLLLPEMFRSEAALELFKREARALYRLQHEAIVRYYVFAVEPALERPYLAMEFIDGRSLSQLLADDGPLPFEAVCEVIRRIAGGLGAAHACGIVHRDVTPDNILVPAGDVARAKIIDFGIARSAQFADKTVIGSGFAGKYNYVSPEQLGLFGGDVTPKSDIYSFGLVLAQALTGHAIDMGGTQVQLVDKRRALPDLSAIDGRLRPLLEAMLQPNPEQRLESMAAVAAWSIGSITSYSYSNAAKSSEAGSGPTAPRPQGRARVWLRVAAAVSLSAIVTSAAAYYYWPKPKTIGDPPRNPRRYIEQYEGGECFLIMPVAVTPTSAVVEGLGASVQPFNRLNDAFKRDNGFEPDIELRQVNNEQCPAVTFLGRLRSMRASAPHIDLDKTSLRSGETLTGFVDRFGTREIDLLLVWGSGTVENVSHLLKPGTDAKTFGIPMQPRGGLKSGSDPQLLLAVASAAPLGALRPGRPMPADSFFPAVLAEKARSGAALAATARYFRLEPQ